MQYFSTFPKMLHDNRIVTDIITRISVRENIADKLSLFYPYYLKDGDTPEIIASKYYGDPTKHWVVLMINNIEDAFFDLPLPQAEFEKYLDEKYRAEGILAGRTGTEYARITININPPGYKATITTTDLYTGVSTTETFYIDEKAYSSGYAESTFDYTDTTIQVGNIQYTQTKSTFTIYDYEYELNEAKRNIKLLRKDYLKQFENEVQNLNSIHYV